MRVRQARADDEDQVVAFTENTWPERFGGDYIPDVFSRWVAANDETQRTLVAERDDDGVIGLVQVVMLSDWEAWLQGMRVAPEHRNEGVGRALSHAAFDWAAEQGATVGRNMVFSWNVQGLGLSRAAGFHPLTEFRWAHPSPDPDANARPEWAIDEDPDAAWSHWQSSSARDALRGIGLHLGESWAVAEVTREVLARAAETESLLVVRRDGVAGMAFRVRVHEREQDGERQQWAEYGAASWDDLSACRELMAAIARDAAKAGAERVRVLIPETARAVSDVSAHRIAVADDPDFVMAADLTEPYRERYGERSQA
ncbi:MAG: N-acetyltransferase family protein [Halodesulfurarchaeum sp.]